MKKSSLLTLLLLAIILLSVGYVAYTSLNIGGDKKGSEASTIFGEESEAVFTDIDGNEIKLSDYAGKLRVVNTWASWCPFCTTELPDFETLANEFSQDDVVVIAINRMEAKERAQRFIATVGDFEKVIFVLDPEDIYYKSVGGFSMPETVFYDSDGNEVKHVRGKMTLEQMRSQIQQMLSQE